jgi:hypothetical protein
MVINKLPLRCPSCENTLVIERLSCSKCDTTVEGCYSLPRLARLTPDDQRFLELFILTSGSLKVTGKRLGLSYPTVKKRLNELIARMAREVERDQAPRAEAPERDGTGSGGAAEESESSQESREDE